MISIRETFKDIVGPDHENATCYETSLEHRSPRDDRHRQDVEDQIVGRISGHTFRDDGGAAENETKRVRRRSALPE